MFDDKTSIFTKNILVRKMKKQSNPKVSPPQLVNVAEDQG
jgi:hypothetical protein